ncbi:MAG: bifunctional (p)ppGpp synthetase/guanosine-3',5'-bis(diphosphate) 3'-pyrophosphohydrolase [Candidatus Aminicenantes bacterium]|nr:bifunctional (p)ppGpp synthetase/guanosine-3',5'-bis(diphosphate) 3'-pyrophosphohydrolase [Candidatus Aminicenantes bacterium]
MIRFNDILEKVAGRFDDKETALLQKAYVFSAKAHKGQVRRSGEPYLSHPLEVAGLLADMNLDSTSLAAGLLHDVLEDTDVGPDELRGLFGKDAADLVESVTKIGRVQEVSPEHQRAETIRKIILAMTDDLRVIFIKLADRLHNLQTLKYLPEDKQRQVAAETLEIYAPIANRLGMGRIKAELEDRAFRYVEPEEAARVEALLEGRRKAAEKALRSFRLALGRALKAGDIPAEIQGRIKRPYSIWRKMKSRKIDFNQVYDFLALRIVTDTVRNCYQALGIIHENWPHIPHRFRDFIAMPKPNLYQALHTTVLTADQSSFEIQVRTKEMHALAENGIAAHWRYKDDDPQSLVREDRRLQWLREMVDLFREQGDPKEFLANLKINLIPEEVYVFTPKGKVVSLPAGASALDFAFRIHSEIGLHAAGALINGKASPLRTLLRTGDIVEIATSPGKTPGRSWLQMAFTSGARHRIKRWLNQQEKSKAVALGRKLWLRQTAKPGTQGGYPAGAALLARLAETVSFRIRTLDDFFSLLGRGRLVLTRKLLDRIARPEGGPWPKDGQEGAAVIQDRERIPELVRLARCCRPIKGEPIVGYLTAGTGIRVHALRCLRVTKELLSPERMVEVSWDEISPGPSRAGVTIEAANIRGLLAKVVAAITGLEGDIDKADVATSPEARAEIRLELTITDIGHLEAIIGAISKIEGILSVDRT